MEQAGEYQIAASRDVVWAALNDPEVLKRCIDGCQSMEQTSETTFATAVKAKIGPVSALFKADLELQDINPPTSYTIQANAKGGAAGFGKGTAGVALEDANGGTLLTYTVNANVGGKLAQIGSRLIDGAARKMADDFFARFAAEVGAPGDAAADAVPAPESAVQAGVDAVDQPGLAEDSAAGSDTPDASGTPTEPTRQPSQQWIIWGIMFAILILAVVLTL